MKAEVLALGRGGTIDGEVIAVTAATGGEEEEEEEEEDWTAGFEGRIGDETAFVAGVA